MSWQKQSESSSWGSWTHCPLWRVDQVTDVWKRLIPTLNGGWEGEESQKIGGQTS